MCNSSIRYFVIVILAFFFLSFLLSVRSTDIKSQNKLSWKIKANLENQFASYPLRSPTVNDRCLVSFSNIMYVALKLKMLEIQTKCVWMHIEKQKKLLEILKPKIDFLSLIFCVKKKKQKMCLKWNVYENRNFFELKKICQQLSNVLWIFADSNFCRIYFTFFFKYSFVFLLKQKIFGMFFFCVRKMEMKIGVCNILY